MDRAVVARVAVIAVVVVAVVVAAQVSSMGGGANAQLPAAESADSGDGGVWSKVSAGCEDRTLHAVRKFLGSPSGLLDDHAGSDLSAVC